MYKRPFIREGDTLTPTGGEVKPRPPQFRITFNGKLACYEGDPVYCYACKSWGVTKCVPPNRPHTDPLGRQANLDGDLCICKCLIPPRLKALFDNVSMKFEEDEIALMAGAISWLANAGHAIEEHEIFYEIVDAKTEKPVDGMTYKLTSGSEILLDNQNLEGGKSKSYSFNSYPNLGFITWVRGNSK